MSFNFLKNTVEKATKKKFNFDIAINSIEGLNPAKIKEDEISFAWTRGKKTGNLPTLKMSVTATNSFDVNQTLSFHAKFDKDKKTNKWKEKKLTLQLRQVRVIFDLNIFILLLALLV